MIGQCGGFKTLPRNKLWKLLTWWGWSLWRSVAAAFRETNQKCGCFSTKKLGVVGPPPFSKKLPARCFLQNMVRCYVMLIKSLLRSLPVHQTQMRWDRNLKMPRSRLVKSSRFFILRDPSGLREEFNSPTIHGEHHGNTKPTRRIFWRPLGWFSLWCSIFFSWHHHGALAVEHGFTSTFCWIYPLIIPTASECS